MAGLVDSDRVRFPAALLLFDKHVLTLIGGDNVRNWKAAIRRLGKDFLLPEQLVENCITLVNHELTGASADRKYRRAWQMLKPHF